MNKEFLSTIFNEQPHDIEGAKTALRYLVKTVLETNKMIGMDHTDRDKWLPIYYKLRVEEGSELITAIDNEDAVEVVDAILDTLVVGCYENTVFYGSEHIDKFIINALQFAVVDYTLERDIVDFKVLLEERTNSDKIGCLFACAASMFTRLNIDHMKAVKEVTNSNLSKFPTLNQLLGDFAGETDKDLCGFVLNEQCEMIEAGGRYSGVTAEAVTNGSGATRYVFWTAKEYGEPKVKYVKPCTFFEPDFASCILKK